MNSQDNGSSSLFSDDFYLTEGGLETTLIFQKGIDLPHFASFELLRSQAGRQALRAYYRPYLELARLYQLNFIMDTPTWRANPDWGYKLGYAQHEINQINEDAVHFLKQIKRTANLNTQVLINGCIGPRGDGYHAIHQMSFEEAYRYHHPQIHALSKNGVDLVSGLTITYPEEAIGIVQAAKASKIPVVISFTVETDGRLPSGTSLEAAIEQTDEMTGSYATHYMINCAHPNHFSERLADGISKNWTKRIKAIRANASTKSHEELDQSTELDRGDQHDLARKYADLKKLLPNLKIWGGCCGTDHQHLKSICEKLIRES